MGLFIRLDEWVLKTYERVSHWWEYAFERNCFWLARQSVWLSTFFWLVTCYFSYFRIGPIVLLVMGANFFFLLWFLKGIDTAEKEWVKTEGRTLNRFSEDWRVRITVLWFVLSTESIFVLEGGEQVTDVIRQASLFFLLSAFYFQACTPLPPGALREPRLAPQPSA